MKTTVLAGMLMPMEKVSVAKRHLMRPSWKRISITSYKGRAKGGAERERGGGEGVRGE